MRLRSALAVGVLSLVAASALRAAAPGQTPVFRAGAVLVPIDVRVLDSAGRSITDLTSADFQVFEDGVAQNISHFSAQTIMPAAADDRLAARRASFGMDIPQQGRRIFLFVLGRGRLQEPSMAVDAVLRFVRELLLPQDQIAVLAWDRATDFTADHASVLAVLERFKKRHHHIEQMLRDRFSGLAAVYGGKLLPKDIQAEIDGVFLGPEQANMREVPPGRIANEQRLDEDNRRTADQLMGSRADLVMGNLESEPMAASFESFVAENRQTMQDLGNLYTGIEYLRRLEGEKHLVFLTERGINLPRLEDDTSLAALAADARVAIDTIQTGGVLAAPVPTAGAPNTQTMPSMSAAMRESQAARTLRTISTLTGGQTSVFGLAHPAMDGINNTTRFSYLLGYTPANTNWDAKYRRINVKVTRPGVTVHFRHGYFGTPALMSFDHRELVTSSRLNAAASYREEIRDLKVDGTAASVRAGGATVQIYVEIAIDPSRLKFQEFPGERRGRVSIVIACFGSNGQIVGQRGADLNLTLDDVEFPIRLRTGIRFDATIPVSGPAATVKAVVYDFASDLVGTKILRVK